MRSRLDRQLRLIVECLERHGVSYVVIGGVAAMLQDVPIQETIDVDVVPERSARNVKALASALREMEARLRVPGDPDGVEIPLDERTFEDVTTLTFVTRFGPFDILFEPAGAADFAALVARARVLERFGIDIAVASLDDLVAMKRATGREKDAAHLRILLEHARGRGMDEV
ncbi:MAG TPA: hypothetical protein VHI71_09985 [Actinomycetota bacterium]|nr:hypothetical protein [Actinomycetota bacterium]